MNEVKPPKKSMVYYYLIMIVVLLCINAWIVPALSGQKIQEVDYSTFLNMLDEKSIAQVEIQDNQIAFNSYRRGYRAGEPLANGRRTVFKSHRAGIFAACCLFNYMAWADPDHCAAWADFHAIDEKAHGWAKCHDFWRQRQ